MAHACMMHTPTHTHTHANFNCKGADSTGWVVGWVGVWVAKSQQTIYLQTELIYILISLKFIPFLLIDITPTIYPSILQLTHASPQV